MDDIHTGEMIIECGRCDLSTGGYKRGWLKKRLENHIVMCKAAMSEVGEYHITLRAETNRAVEQAGQDGDCQDDLPADPCQHCKYCNVGCSNVSQI